MKNSNKNIGRLLLIILLFSGCKNIAEPVYKEDKKQQQIHEEEEGIIRLSLQQQKAIGLQTGKIRYRNMNSSIRISGQLELPPQYHAKVSTFIGGNIKKIKVIEGDFVRKGQVLAVVVHPDYIELQQGFQQTAGSLDFLKAEYLRKKTLYNREVSSAREYQKALANYNKAMTRYRGLKEKLKLIGLDPASIEEGEINASILIKSPIEGYIKAVNVSTGQYVPPQLDLFEVINNKHVHADFKVYEKDVYKVKEGQKINFTVPNLPGKVLQAKIFSVGKNIETHPRAVHLHADVLNEEVSLIPGMYVDGRLLVDDIKVKALPSEAIVTEAGKSYIFIKSRDASEQTDSSAIFRMIEVTTGISDLGYTAVNLWEPLADSIPVVTKGAYYLQADLTKGENEHSH